MEKIKIITDSTADLPPHIVEQYDIGVLPLLVNFEDESYMDGVDINLNILLEKMKKSDEFPGTAQVNPQRFMECYKKYIDDGYKIFSIHLSSKLSGTYQSACIAKNMLETDDIVVIDSKNVTSGLGLLVIKAAQLKAEGLELSKIENEINNLIPHVKSSLAFETLDNLVKGGRLSKTAGVIGNILGIRPIIEIKDGEVVINDKVRGNKRVARTILDYIDKKGIKQGQLSVLLHVENKDILNILRDGLKERGKEFIECEVGCVIGVHAGEGACGIFFIEDY